MVEIYSYFVSKIYDREFFYMDITEVHKKIIGKFPDVSKDYIFDYCIFQFYYMISKNPKYKEQRIPFGTIFNQKGVDRFHEKKDGYMHYATIGLQQYGIDKNDILTQKWSFRNSSDIIDVEEKEKRRFFNTGNGFSHCIVTTSLFNGKSLYCIRCKWRSQCKELLKKKYFPIYIDRKVV